MRSPEFNSEGPNVLATLHCPHGYRFVVYDKCPALEKPERVPPPPVPPGFIRSWWIARRARRLRVEDFLK